MKFKKSHVYLFSFLLSSSLAAQQKNVFDESRMLLKPVKYSDVQLNSGPLKSQLEEVKDYYLNISNDDLLKGFRQRKGFDTKGAKNLGGWYSNDMFHVFGQILGGLSRLYAATGDERCKQKANFLINEWGKTIDSDGYFFYSKKPNAPHYTYEKMVGGLVDNYIFTGNQNSLKHLNTITDWAIKNLNRERLYGQTQSEWYTLSENLYKAYKITNDKKYYDFGKLWEYTDYWNSYQTPNVKLRDQRHHAYSHVNTLSGAAAAYFLDGDDRYKTIIKNAYDFLQREQCFATGGYGPNERFLSKDDLVKTLSETQCGSWAIFKLSKYLIEATGDAKYGDWIEKMLYNGIGANVPMDTAGKVQYYSDYHPREGSKFLHPHGWSCCTGTRPQAVAEYENLIYFTGNDGLYVNLMVPSQIEWNGMNVVQNTFFPEKNYTEVQLQSQKNPGSFSIAFRKPSWMKDKATVEINGRAVQPVIENNWIKIKNNWKNGDKITVSYPMELYLDRLDDTKVFPAAVMYGPVAMAVAAVDPYPYKIAMSDPKDNFTFNGKAPLNYDVKNYPGLVLKPYYQYKMHEPYSLYIDTAGSTIVLSKDLEFKGDWIKSIQHGRDHHYAKVANEYVRTKFNGSGIKVFIIGFRNSGKAQVWIDGKMVEEFDTFSGKENEKSFVKGYGGLMQGTHEIKLVATGQKVPGSKDSFINFRRFEVIP